MKDHHIESESQKLSFNEDHFLVNQIAKTEPDHYSLTNKTEKLNKLNKKLYLLLFFLGIFKNRHFEQFIIFNHFEFFC